MSFQTYDIAGTIEVRDFLISQIGVDLGTAKTTIVLAYKAIGNPSTMADLAAYQYSMDGGTTWETMTPAVGTVISGISFTPTGTSMTFEWNFMSNIGYDMYNTYISVRLIADNGVITTTPAYFTVFFTRTTTDMSLIQKYPPFPDDYSGTPGNDLLANAPKVVA